jgi:hypothetical protein
VNATGTEPAHFDLGGTASYARRRASWYPGRGSHADPRAGTLRIVVQRGDRPGDGDDATDYGVQVAPPDETPVGCVTFLLLNDTPPAADADPERSEIYKVTVNPMGAGCTCRGASNRRARSCKHGDAILAALKDGCLGGSQ